MQHSSSISGLGMTELLDQLDRATGRIHVRDQHCSECTAALPQNSTAVHAGLCW